MKAKNFLYYFSLVYGIIVTFLILVVFVPKLIGEAIEKGIGIVPDILTTGLPGRGSIPGVLVFKKVWVKFVLINF